MAESKKDRSEYLAEVISLFTNPALIVVISLAIITSHFASNAQEFWRWGGFAFLLLVLPSALYVFYTWKKERRIDLDITRREDRIVPLMLASLGALFAGYLIQTRQESASLLLLSNVLVAMLVLLTIVTFVWKISLHAATLMATVSLIIVFRGWEFAWLYLLIIPIAWARLRLNQHTPAQLLAGSLSGVAITFLASALFRS